MPDVISEQYNAGGYGYTDNGGSVSGGLGRFWNNVSGTTANNLYNAQQADLERQFNSTEAQKQRDFEERMSSTAYARAVKDMQAAGINPASLSASSMSPASTPGGSAASSTKAQASPGGHNIIGSLLTAIFAGVALAGKTKAAKAAAKTAAAPKFRPIWQ